MTTSMIFNYTSDRYEALRLVSRNLISSVGTVMRRNDGRDLEPSVSASLLALRNDGYLEQHPLSPDTANLKQGPVQLGLRGIGLLSQFNLERARYTAESTTRSVVNAAACG